jgi:hypothetical protein
LILASSSIKIARENQRFIPQKSLEEKRKMKKEKKNR